MREAVYSAVKAVRRFGWFVREAFCFSYAGKLLLAIRKYDLDGKVTINRLNDGYTHRVTLYHVVEMGETDTPLPEAFISRVRKIVQFIGEDFVVDPTAITSDEVRKRQKAWNEHCAMFWAGCD